MARPTKLTPQVQATIVGAFFLDASFSEACELAGIPASTGYEWLARGKATDPRRPPAPRYVEFAWALVKAGFVEARPPQAVPVTPAENVAADGSFADTENRGETTATADATWAPDGRYHAVNLGLPAMDRD